MTHTLSRRTFLGGCTAAAMGLALHSAGDLAADDRPALIAITLDLEMSRNFPIWEATHWDYEKGNLDADTKAYAREACRRVKARGGLIHCFCVARVLEQENVDWLKEMIAEGHPVGNHTYDHVNLLASRPEDIQFRFARAPWLMRGKSPSEVITENVRIASEAMRTRLGIPPAGFRTPGGFSNGLQGRVDLQKMLLEQGFSWISSKYPAHKNTRPMERPTDEVFASIVAAQAAAQPFVYPSGLVELPMSPISDIGAFRTGRWPLDDFLEAIRRAVAWTIEHRAVYDFLAHPSCLVATDPAFRAIDLLCDLVEQSRGRAKIATLSEIANRVDGARPE